MYSSITTACQQKQESLDNLKVLIVEDNEYTRDTIRGILSGMKIGKIYDAPDGSQALQFLDYIRGGVDIVLCDWDMPVQSGDDLLDAIHSRFPHIPVVMVTGRADIHSIRRAKDMGVTGYVLKPFSPKQIKEKLSSLIRRPEHIPGLKPGLSHNCYETETLQT